MESIICIHNKNTLKSIIFAALAVSFIAPPAFSEDMAPKALLAMAGELSLKAYQMAVEAKAIDDYYMAQHAFALATEAAGLVGEASAIIQKHSDAELEQAARNAAKEIRKVIIQAQIAARKISDTSLDPEVVHAANFLFNSCEFALMQFGGPQE